MYTTASPLLLSLTGVRTTNCESWVFKGLTHIHSCVLVSNVLRHEQSCCSDSHLIVLLILMAWYKYVVWRAEYHVVSKKQRKQLVGVEDCLPPHLLPVRQTHSSGSLAKDLELLITPHHNPFELSDQHLLAALDRYISSKRTRRKQVG